MEQQSLIIWLFFLADVGGAQMLATGKSAEVETDFKYAVIRTALGFAILAGFLVLKICMIRKHLSDNDSSDPKSTPLCSSDTAVRKRKNSSGQVS
ncbi:transmembrane protein 273 [Thomomys bottae]